MENPPFPTFASLAEAEAYSGQHGDAYFKICYHLEGNLNLCLEALHDLYANAPSAKRPKMQTGIVREILCPDGLLKDPSALTATLLTCARFRHEETSHASIVNEAMTALALEKEHDGSLPDAAFDNKTFEPLTARDAENAQRDLLRLCDWIESRFHFLTHRAWYQAPDSFSTDPDKAHLANIGFAQRYLGNFSERDRKRWEGIHGRAAAEHRSDLKKWSTVGKVQHDPEPRTWTHPGVDSLIIGLWPLVVRHNWTYTDLLKILDQLLPADNRQSVYPLDSVESLKVHCRTICGLTKTGKGRSASGLPEGWKVAEQLFSRTGK